MVRRDAVVLLKGMKKQKKTNLTLLSDGKVVEPDFIRFFFYVSSASSVCGYF